MASIPDNYEINVAKNGTLMMSTAFTFVRSS